MTQLSDLDNLKVINVGINADDGTGDSLRNAFIKVNDNFALTKEVLAYLLTNAGAEGLSLDTIWSTLPPSVKSMPDLVRAMRNDKLKELDTLVSNPLRYATFSDSYKLALAEYRNALLDVPQQPGFPENITWPAMPNLV